MKLNLVIILILMSAGQAFADPKEFYFQKLKQSRTLTKNIRRTVEAKEFTQKLDHFNHNDERTFKQRWYIDTSFATSNTSPVLFYICGESTCDEDSIKGGAIVAHARKFNATLIALEHRYYGKSIPLGALTTENLKYLSTDQAVEDLAHFQKTITSELGLRTKWITIGGSYPGSLSAYYRLKYPQLVLGALASSAPVKAHANFQEYDEHVTEVVGETCANNMREVVREIENKIDKNEDITNIKELFNASDIHDNVDFLYLVADIGAMAAQYGYVTRFCNNLATEDKPLKGYGRFAREILREWGLRAISLSAAGATNTDPNSYLNGFGMRQWFYQSCTEYGYWQVAHPTKSVRSARINMEYHDNICKRLFGITTPVDTTHINETFFKPLAQSSNIVFTNGSTDPWAKLSLLPGDIESNTLDFYMINGAAHCDDLRTPRFTDSVELKASRELFENKISEWLTTENNIP